MPRPPRITPAGLVYHALGHAVEGLRFFQDPAEYEQFYRLLLNARDGCVIRVIAYGLMPNHWHLVLWPLADGAVSEYIHRVTTKHSLRFRAQTHSVGRGHVYKDRFHCFAVETADYYYNLLRYVEANALTARLVMRAESWPWSSLSERLHGGDLITDGPLDLPHDWIDQVNLALPKSEVDVIEDCEQRGRPYGSADWVTRVAGQQSLEQALRPRGRPRRAERLESDGAKKVPDPITDS